MVAICTPWSSTARRHHRLGKLYLMSTNLVNCIFKHLWSSGYDVNLLKVASSILARCMSAARMWRCAFGELAVGCGSGARCVAVSHTTTVALLGRNMCAGGVGRGWCGKCLCASLRSGGRVVDADAWWQCTPWSSTAWRHHRLGNLNLISTNLVNCMFKHLWSSGYDIRPTR